MGDIAEAIENGDDPYLALDDHGITDPGERKTLEMTIAAMQRLHNEGRNHIWAYYTRNLVRPVALSRSKVDVIVGNPPWLNYNRTVSTLRTELERQSKNIYGIWTGGKYATHQDVAGLFFARSVDLYLKDGGVIGWCCPTAHCRQANILSGAPAHGKLNPAVGEGTARPDVCWRPTLVTRLPGTLRGWNPTHSFPFRRR